MKFIFQTFITGFLKGSVVAGRISGPLPYWQTVGIVPQNSQTNGFKLIKSARFGRICRLLPQIIQLKLSNHISLFFLLVNEIKCSCRSSCFTFVALLNCIVYLNYCILVYLTFENNLIMLVTADYYDPLNWIFLCLRNLLDNYIHYYFKGILFSFLFFLSTKLRPN